MAYSRIVFSYLVDAFHDLLGVQLVLVEQDRDEQVRYVSKARANHLLGRVKAPDLSWHTHIYTYSGWSVSSTF